MQVYFSSMTAILTSVRRRPIDLYRTRLINIHEFVHYVLHSNSLGRSPFKLPPVILNMERTKLKVLVKNNIRMGRLCNSLQSPFEFPPKSL